MKKLIKKFEKYILRNKNKVKIINEIFECANFYFPIMIGILLMIGMGPVEGFLMIMKLDILSLFYGFLMYTGKIFFEKWKKSEEKDLKESENE